MYGYYIKNRCRPLTLDLGRYGEGRSSPGWYNQMGLEKLPLGWPIAAAGHLETTCRATGRTSNWATGYGYSRSAHGRSCKQGSGKNSTRHPGKTLLFAMPKVTHEKTER